MKIKYILAAICIIFLISCSSAQIEENTTEKVEETTKEVQDMPDKNQDQEPTKPKKEEPTNNVVVEIPEEEPSKEIENIVFIKDKGLTPENLTIYQGDSVTWIINVEKISNNQPRGIACYIDGSRVFKSDRMTKQGQEDSFTFKKSGEYMCQEFIYGKRSYITVKSKSHITGAFIGAAGETGILPLIFILSLLGIGMMYIHGIRTDSV